MISYQIELIESIIFMLAFAAFVGCFILGGSVFQSHNLIGKAFNKCIKFADFPIIRLIPKIFYLASRYSSYFIFFKILLPHLVTREDSLLVYKIPYVISFVTSLLLYIIVLAKAPKEIESKDPEMLCEVNGKYYVKYDHFSRFFHIPIAQSNHLFYFLFGISVIVNSVAFNSLSIRYLLEKIKTNPSTAWSENRYYNSVILLSKLYTEDPKISFISCFEMILVFWGFSNLSDSFLMFLSGKSRYRLINNDKIKNTKRERLHQKAVAKKKVK